MTRIQALVDEAMPRMREISNYLYWNDAQRAERVIEGAFFEGGPVCLIPVFSDGSYGHTTIKATYVERPFWVVERRAR
jgi:hypothetical protein